MTSRDRTLIAGLCIGWALNSILASVFGPWDFLSTLAWGATVLGLFSVLRWWMEPRP